MKNIASTTDLKEAIRKLESEQRISGLELKEDFTRAYQSYNPINLLKDKLIGVESGRGAIESLVIGGIGLMSGYLARKLVVGSSTSIFRKLMGSAMQFGTSTIITGRSGMLKPIGMLLINWFSSKKKKKSQPQSGNSH